MSSKKSHFKDDWLKLDEFTTWLMRGNDNLSARCRICKKSIDISGMGVSALKSHAKGKKHVQNFERTRSEEESTPDLHGFFSRPSTSTGQGTSAGQGTSETASTSSSQVSPYLTKESTLKSEILWSLHTTMRHNSYRSNDEIPSLFQAMFPDSDIARNFSFGRTKASYMTRFGLGPYFHDLLTQEAGRSEDGYVVLFDESLNKITKTCQMDVYIRLWDVNECVTTRYFTSKFLGHAKSEDLLVHMNEAITDLELRKIVQIGMDGPNVNWSFVRKFKDDVKTRTQSGETFLDIGSCGLHTIHGAMKDGLKETGWKIDEFLKSLYWLFKDSPARREDLMSVSGEDKLFPLKFCKHRWLENTPVAERALTILPNIRAYMTGVESKKFSKPTSKSYETVKTMLRDPLLQTKLQFFMSVSQHLTPFLQLYQRDCPMLPFFSRDLVSCLKGLLTKICPGAIIRDKCGTVSDLLSFDLSDKSNLNSVSKVDLGFAANESLKSLYSRKKVSDLQCREIRESARKGIVRIVEKLKKNSPLRYGMVRDLRCLDPVFLSEKPDDCTNMFSRVIKNWAETKKISLTQCDTLRTEFALFVNETVVSAKSDFAHFDYMKQRLDQFYAQKLKKCSRFQNLWPFFRRLLMLSHGQASVERGFSVNKEIDQENLTELSVIAQRQVIDHVNHVGGILNVQLSKKLIYSASSASKRYNAFLEETRKSKSEEEAVQRRKKILDQIHDLKNRKRKLEEDSASLVTSADNLAEEAEIKNGSAAHDLVVRSNSYRRTAKEKTAESKKVVSDIEELMNSLKAME